MDRGALWATVYRVKSLRCVRLLATLLTAAYQAPLSMGFSRQEYWSGVPLPSPVLGPSSPKITNEICHHAIETSMMLVLLLLQPS